MYCLRDRNLGVLGCGLAIRLRTSTIPNHEFFMKLRITAVGIEWARRCGGWKAGRDGECLEDILADVFCV
jgi:hypothetical protein